MTLGRARIIKAAELAAHESSEVPSDGPTAIAFDESVQRPIARRVSAMVIEARAQAETILSEAGARGAALVAEARSQAQAVGDNAAKEATERAVAKVMADHIAFRVSEERRAEREVDRAIELSALLAERVVGEALAIEPARIAKLAETALSEARGARRMRIEASPADVPALQKLLGDLGDVVASIEPNVELARGSLIVHTELGRIDARLGPQLSRLAEALREALRGAS